MNDKTNHENKQTHQQHLLESASAWLDGEAGELESKRLEKASDNVELSSWIFRQQLVRQALHNELGEANVRTDISAAVREAIEQEPQVETVVGLQPAASTCLQSGEAVSAPASIIKKPFAGFAIAASIALAVFVGFQQPPAGNGVSYESPNTLVKASSVGVPQQSLQTVSLNSKRLSPGQAELSNQSLKFQVSRIEVSPEMAAHLQQRYVEHAEQAAFSGSYGLLPYARTSGEF